MEDPYAWPFPKRQDLMSLQTIKTTKVPVQQRESTTLSVAGIDGATSIMKPYRYTNKEVYYNRTDDIDGTRSKQLIKSSNREDLQLQTQDIQGTRPQIVKFQTGRYSGNPLEPVYVIPSFTAVSPVEPKFIRDSFQVNDIEGTHPQSKSDKLKKTPIQYEDVEGSHPKHRREVKDYNDSLHTQDINQYRLYKTNRTTNPLMPNYVHRDEDGKCIEIGNVQGSTSKQLHPKEINKVASSTLLTQDIKGAQADTHAQLFLRTKERRNIKQSNQINDIDHVSAGSLKKGIVTIRQTNPLVPNYQLPGNKEVYAGQSMLGRNGSSTLVSNAQKFDKFLH